MSDHTKFVKLATRLIAKHGRTITFSKVSGGPGATPGDPAKPWRGAASAPSRTNSVDLKAVFVVPQTSIPSESRGLGFDWIDQDLLSRVREVCLVSAEDAPVGFEDDYKIIEDDSKLLSVEWGQCLRPGDQKILFVLGVRR